MTLLNIYVEFFIGAVGVACGFIFVHHTYALLGSLLDALWHKIKYSNLYSNLFRK